MKLISCFSKINLLFCILSGLNHALAQQSVPIIPQPAGITYAAGSFLFDEAAGLRYTDPALKPAADWWVLTLQDISGKRLPVNKEMPKMMTLSLDPTLKAKPEHYRLEVTTNRINLRAGGYGGIFYGMQSLLQALPAIRTNAPLRVPCMQVEDYPRFSWRGLHLDVSRHFFSIEVIERYIDLMAAYKMNTFHWHLVDDQGWRIEIKKYPKLTSVGAWRADYTALPWGARPQAKPGEEASYGGYYTQQQLRDIVAYAKTRNVTIVPEIEMPGHVAAAIAAYPALSCTQQPQLPLTGGNYTGMSSNYCAGNDSVYQFLEDVLKETLDIFPSAFVHLGGDEVDKTPWMNCARCRKRMQQEGLKSPEELQSYFMKRMERFLLSQNRKMIGWDEILEGGLAPNAAVMSWRGESGGVEAATMNHQVVMSPGFPCYFDHYQAEPEGEPLAIGGMNTLKNVYDYEPIPRALPADKAGMVLGAQANVWTEFISTPAHLMYMILPRMPALAEVLWTPRENKNWEGFNQRLKTHFNRYDQLGLPYSKGNCKVDIIPLGVNGKLSVSMQSEALNSSIHYTTDGSEPGLQSPRYAEPLPVNASQTIKAILVTDGKVMSKKTAVQRIVLHKASGLPVQYDYPYSNMYTAGGQVALTDGIKGGQAIGKNWQGIEGKPLVAVIDLGKTEPIQYLSAGFLQRYSDWIFLPRQVTFSVSLDGKNFTETGTVIHTISPSEKTAQQHEFETRFAPVQARYIRINATPIPGCPKGHPGEGKQGWLFADEIIVE